MEKVSVACYDQDGTFVCIFETTYLDLYKIGDMMVVEIAGVKVQFMIVQHIHYLRLTKQGWKPRLQLKLNFRKNL